MKIVVTGTRGIPNIMGGVETHSEQLFPRLAKMGFDVVVIRRSSYVSKDEALETIVEDGRTFKLWQGVKLYDVNAPKSKVFEAIVHTFKAVVVARKLHADVLHIHAVGPALMTTFAHMMGMKVVFTHHGPDYNRDKWGFFAKCVLRMGERVAAKQADKIIVISDVIRRLLLRKYHRRRNMTLIYNGVPMAEPCDYSEYFERLGIEEGKYVMAMCRFVKEKNLHHLVEAFDILKREKPELQADGIKLVLVGDADFPDTYSENLKQLAAKQGVVLTGFVKGRKLSALLTHTCCYCLPSSHEGLPISLLEAMSYGVRVVVSDIPANKEVRLPDNCYFHCGDVRDLANHLNDILSLPSSYTKYDMGKYDWDRIACQVAKVYNSLQ